MKRFLSIFAVTAAFFLTSCQIGSYSVASGVEDTAGIVVTSGSNRDIKIVVDGTSYDCRTVKDKGWKKDRKIRKTYKKALQVSSGQHEIEIIDNGVSVKKEKVILSSGEMRVINI